MSRETEKRTAEAEARERHGGRQPAAHSGAGDPPHDDAGPAALEPMDMSFMGRLFAVPLLIIGGIVGGAILVVLLFAGPAAPEPRSVTELLQALETSGGDRRMGMLLPHDKELWQAAQELSLRLQEKDKEPKLETAELQDAARRLTVLIRKELDRLQSSGFANLQETREGSARLQYMVRALARTEQPAAVDTLLTLMEADNEFYKMLAIKEMAELHELPESRRSLEPIVGILSTSSAAPVKLVACTALSVLARPDDQQVIDALASARLSAEGEVGWSAALALARLGSDRGRTTLMDLLDREFLSSPDLYTVEDARGEVHRYPMPQERVAQILMAAIDAASSLDDAALWEMIAELAESDPSPAVRAKAQDVLRERV